MSTSRTESRKRSRSEAGGGDEAVNVEGAGGQEMGVQEQAPWQLTDECHHYSRLKEVPWDVQKYWQQRYTTFSRYDEGLYLTDDLWFGVTPEPVARRIAKDLADRTPSHITTILDLFSGASNNSIAFAQSGRWSRIIAIECSASVLACAHHNASIYGVAHLITFVHADVFSFLGSALPSSSSSSVLPASQTPSVDLSDLTGPISPESTTIFASPPWGGPGYRTDEIFDVNAMQPYGLAQIHHACREVPHALYLPRTSDLRQIARCARSEKQKIEVVQMCVEGASKAMVVYIPAFRS